MSRLLVTSLAIALFGVSLANAEVKMGLVDFARMQKNYYRTYEARKAFEDRQAEANTKLEEKTAAFKKLLQEQEKATKDLNDSALSEEKKKAIAIQAQERLGQMNSLKREAMELESKARAELGEEASKIQKELTTEIYDMIGTVAEKKELDIVFNRSFGINGVPTVAYSSTKTLVDFTDEVITALNVKAPKGWKPPVEKEGDKKEGDSK